MELRALREAGICVLPSATRAVDALHGLVTFAARRRRHGKQERGAAASRPAVAGDALTRTVGRARADGRRVLSSAESLELLHGYGVAAPRAQRARSPEEAARALADIQPPVAVKVESPDLLHKTDAGALRLGVVDGAEARCAFDEVVEAARRHVPQSRIDGVLVQEMVRGVVLDVEKRP